MPTQQNPSAEKNRTSGGSLMTLHGRPMTPEIRKEKPVKTGDDKWASEMKSIA